MQSEAKLLNILILKWLNLQGWVELRDIQEKAIRPILSAKKDVIISAATASGKTEAAFLPSLEKRMLVSLLTRFSEYLFTAVLIGNIR